MDYPFGEPADYRQQQQAQDELTERLYEVMDKLNDDDAQLIAWACGLKFQRSNNGQVRK